MDKQKITERVVYKTYSGQETPIALCKCEDEQWRIIAGNNLLTTISFDSMEDAKEYLDDTDVELIGSLCMMFVDGLLAMRNQEQEKAKEDYEQAKPETTVSD